MKQQTKADEKNYKKSNEIVEVSLKRFDKRYARHFLSCVSTSRDARLLRAQSLCDYLCDKFRIPSVRVIVTDNPQPFQTNENGRLRKKTLGLYYPDRKSIVLYNTTAMKHQAVSIKTMFDTLCHEFIHHYDTTKLGLNSIHTKGFYMRISDLQRKIIDK